MTGGLVWRSSVVKPFTFEILLARVRALLRRQHADHPSVLTFTDLTLDTSSHEARRGQREVVLTSLEFKLLRTFLEHPRQALAKDTLLAWVWRADGGLLLCCLQPQVNLSQDSAGTQEHTR